MNIIITGTHKGIGYQLARYYLEQGHQVIGCSRHESAISHVAYTHICVDICNEEQVQAFAKKVRKIVSHIDVLINNAGAASMNHFMVTPVETARRLMELNYLGGFSCIRAFVSLLRKAEHPRVINFSTVAVPFHLEGELVYAASKAAVESMTKILAKELAVFHITVNAVGPAPINTDLIKNVSKDKLDKILENQAIHRFAEMTDIENVLDFYMRSESDFITGQIIYLGGVNR